MDKPRVLILGGLSHNLPAELRRACEIVRHVTVDDMKKWEPSLAYHAKVDICLVFVKYAPPSKVRNAEKALASLPGVNKDIQHRMGMISQGNVPDKLTFDGK